MSFYDELKQYENLPYGTVFGEFDAIKHGIKDSSECMVIKCNNVTEYCYENKFFNNAQFGIGDFSNIKLPFSNMFIETQVLEEGDKFTIGTLCGYSEKLKENIFVFFAKHNNNIPYCPIIFSAEIDDSGKPIGFSEIWNSTYKQWFIHEYGEDEMEFTFNTFRNYFYIFLLSISFMHCKNVKHIENDPNKEISRQVRRQMERKNKEPLTKYYTLEIEPMKSILQKEGNIKQNGLKKALHICRGHFKDYQEGKGLFGKYHGLYWVDSHVKGKRENGIIIKDYNINVPGKGDF